MRTARLVVASALVAAASLPLVRARAGEVLRVASVRPAPAGELPYRQGELIVQFRGGADDQVAERAIRFSGGREALRSRFGTRFRVALQDGLTLSQALARFTSLPEVEYAEPNGIVRAYQAQRFRPNDELFGYQWHLRMVDAERTWAIQRGDSSVAVAVLDTGIAYEDFGPYRKAPDFGSTVFLQGHDAINNDSHANDDNFHGTHVAATVAESTNNGQGAAGLAFGCALMPVKVLDATGTGSFFEVAEGMDYAINFRQNGQNPVKVINLSLGGDVGSETMRRAVDRAVDAGITVVAASGNESASQVGFPAAYENAIAVGAVDGRKQRAPYSNIGSALDLVAPGGNSRRDDTGLNGAPDGFPDGVLQQTFDPDTAELFGRYDDFAFFFVT
ncbi:MAG TPA: S8 family serine peptidase, partial [Vicinamibacteria bacterium]|nr:S8 family serine peptidase [Vicinamibacteria bacterium]